jgi:hypothetical protein
MLKRESLIIALVSCLAAVPVHAQTREIVAPEAASEADPKARFEWVGAVTPVERAIAECLRESRRTAPDEMGKLLRRIVTPPKGKVEACLAILVQGRVPKVAPDDGPQKLSVPQRELVLAALGELPEKETRAALGVLAAGELDEPKARTVVEVLGVVGTARDLRRLAPLLPRDETGDMPRASRQVLTATYSKILGRDENAMLELGTLLRGRDDLISELVLLAFADRGDPRALGPCFEVARTRPTLAQTAVSLLPRFMGSLDVELRADIATWLRSVADKQRLQWTRAVYGALATYDEGDALPELIEALEGEDRALADAAYLALKRISGVDLSRNAARWNEWFERESRWNETERGALRDHLQSADPAQVVEALKAYSAHGLYRSQLSADLLPLLERREPALRELACQTVGNLKSVAAVHELSLKLQDPVPAVAEAARVALFAIVGAPPRAAAEAPAGDPPSDP